MDLKVKRQREENRRITMVAIPVVAILGKLIQFFILPEKYFYDSKRMVCMMTGNRSMAWWEGYQDTVDIFKNIDFFHFTTIRQWSLELGIVFTILFIILIKRVKEMSVPECIFTLMAIGLMNIYVFNIAKEPIQMFFFICITVIILLPLPIIVRLAGCALVYYWESTTFREYYIMMAAMTIAIFIVLSWLRKRKRSANSYAVIAIIACFIAMYMFMFTSQFVDKKGYEDAISVRDQYANEDATSVINNPIEVNGNYANFVIDYTICAVRMMVPVELIFKSPVYTPFFFYQIFVLVYLFRALKNLNRLNDQLFLALTCFMAYLFGSFVFEPDFGSWVRHEAAAFPVFYFLAYQDLAVEKKDEVEVPMEIAYEAKDF